MELAVRKVTVELTSQIFMGAELLHQNKCRISKLLHKVKKNYYIQPKLLHKVTMEELTSQIFMGAELLHRNERRISED